MGGGAESLGWDGVAMPTKATAVPGQSAHIISLCWGSFSSIFSAGLLSPRPGNMAWILGPAATRCVGHLVASIFVQLAHALSLNDLCYWNEAQTPSHLRVWGHASACNPLSHANRGTLLGLRAGRVSGARSRICTTANRPSTASPLMGFLNFALVAAILIGC